MTAEVTKRPESHGTAPRGSSSLWPCATKQSRDQDRVNSLLCMQPTMLANMHPEVVRGALAGDKAL